MFITVFTSTRNWILTLVRRRRPHRCIHLRGYFSIHIASSKPKDSKTRIIRVIRTLNKHNYVDACMFKSSLSQTLRLQPIYQTLYASKSMNQSLLEKLIVPQLVKTFATFYRTRNLLPCSKEFDSGSHPEPDKSSS